VTAETITFDRDDLSLAKVIQAGLNPTAQQTALHTQQISTGKAAIEANQQAIAAAQVARAQRFSDLGEYDVKHEAKVFFATGAYTISAEAKEIIAALAKEALGSGGPKAYLIQVSGFADTVGNAANNEVLSKRRAEAIVAYLLQACAIPVGRIVSPGALGESNRPPRTRVYPDELRTVASTRSC
jgi:outer membrane protein OmpA-like peptidoglycan-associated protein